MPLYIPSLALISTRDWTLFAEGKYDMLILIVIGQPTPVEVKYYFL